RLLVQHLVRVDLFRVLCGVRCFFASLFLSVIITEGDESTPPHLPTDSASPTEMTGMVRFVRFNKPARTLPGPSSMKKSQRRSMRRCMQSAHRTVPVT